MKKNKYEIRKQNAQNEKDEDWNIKIIKVFLELNRYARYHTGKCNRIQINEQSIIKNK